MGTDDSERRGTSNTPAEGRRGYDLNDSMIERIDTMLSRARRVGMGITFLFCLAIGMFYWLGYRGIGPGARSDELQAQMNQNKLDRALADSMQSQRLSRLERVVATMAYEMCMTQAHTDASVCAKSFTDTP